MTQEAPFRDFLLRKGLGYTRCNLSLECNGQQLGTTQKDRKYEIVIQKSPDGIPISASAYRPNQKACLSSDPARCEFDLLFEGEQLDILLSNYPSLNKIQQNSQQSLQAQNFSSSNSTQSGQTNSGPSATHNGMTDGLTPSLALGLLGGLVASAAVITVIYIWLKRRRQKSIGSPQHNNVISAPKTRQSSELSESDRIAIAREVMKQLSPTIKKIQSDLDSKISNLVEVKFMEQYQKDQALNIKAPPIGSIVPDISFSMKEPATYLPPLPPPPLSIDIIKQAVLDWSYQGIASYQFDFVTETIQSQKGEVDIKSFSIDGNQDQSDSRSVSEFIAINCQGVAYLIPNILQNAADPARTISRHPRIFKRGIGSDLKNLEKLPIVRRTGDCYELVEMGQIV